jgi:hypothetical protein
VRSGPGGRDRRRGIYLRPFVVHPTWPPFGFDPYGYAWRASVVAQRGIRSIPRLPDRPAHPVLVVSTAVAGVLGAVAQHTARRSCELPWSHD